MFLWKSGKKLISHSLSDNDSMGCVYGFLVQGERAIAPKKGIDIARATL
jgi:hypothetical protein